MLHDIKGIRLVLVRQAVTERERVDLIGALCTLSSYSQLTESLAPCQVEQSIVFRICQQFQVPTHQVFAQANVYNFSKGAPNSTNKCLVAVVFHPTIIIMGTDKEDWINTID